MAGGGAEGDTYSPGVAFIYVFNLVVGTGVLALPAVLTSGGWILGSTFLLAVAFLSYVGVTFMIEAMATTNAVLVLRQKITGEAESSPLLSEAQGPAFSIVKKTEMGQMAEMFFGRAGRVAFYVSLIVYLFGDAAIYCTFVPKSLVNFAFPVNPPDWAFYAFLSLFVVLIMPFCFFDFAKTKLLQIATLVVRQAALFTIIGLAGAIVLRKGVHVKEVPDFSIPALPNLFGGAVYAFMCHHSLPGIITPMENKAAVFTVVTAAFLAIFGIYMALFVTCGLAFGMDALDPITFNFNPTQYGWIGDFLLLFPVFTLSSSFPILCITLRNNLSTLIDLIRSHSPEVPVLRKRSDREEQATRRGGKEVPEIDWQRRIALTLLTVLPPLAFCIAAQHWSVDVNTLVGFTGAFAGSAVMFIIPACLVHASRMELPRIMVEAYPLREGSHPDEFLRMNKHASPFRGKVWVIALIVWAVIAIAFNTYEEVMKMWHKE